MSARSDFSFEMSGEPLDDALAPFAEEVRFAVSGPPPVPSPALAAVLAEGFSPTEKGDLLVTAASNVHGPAPQAAGLPNWNKEKKNEMPVTGVLAGLLAKLGGIGTAAKAALAGATTVATMGLAGGAAGVLPAPAQHVVAAAVGAATPFEFPDGDVTAVVERTLPALPVDVTVPPVTVPATTPPTVGAGATAGAKTGAGSTSASAKTSAGATTPTVPGVTVPSIPQVTVPPAVGNLVAGLPACVKNLIPSGGGTPDPTRLAAEIPACIPQILGTANLPPEVAACVSSVLGAIGGASGMPSISGLSVSSCVPMDASKCVSSMLSLLSTMPGLNTLPGLNLVTGCAPMDVTKCITSMTAGVSAGGVPKLDLSACMPTAAPTALPGLGSLPGLSGALPFFGR